VIDTKTPEPFLEDILIVQEFPNIFLEEIPGMSSLSEVEFYIDLVPGATPYLQSPLPYGHSRT